MLLLFLNIYLPWGRKSSSCVFDGIQRIDEDGIHVGEYTGMYLIQLVKTPKDDNKGTKSVVQASFT